MIENHTPTDVELLAGVTAAIRSGEMWVLNSGEGDTADVLEGIELAIERGEMTLVEAGPGEISYARACAAVGNAHLDYIDALRAHVTGNEMAVPEPVRAAHRFASPEAGTSLLDHNLAVTLRGLRNATCARDELARLLLIGLNRHRRQRRWSGSQRLLRHPE